MRARLAGVLVAITLGCQSPAPAPPSSRSAPPVETQKMARVLLPDGSHIDVEIAADYETRRLGLMFRDALPVGRGMLFLFRDSGYRPFWMKDVRFPIDIIWIDEGRRIVHIERAVPPCQADPCPNYPPGKPSRYVLELPAGDAAARGMKLGDVLRFEGIESYVVQ